MNVDFYLKEFQSAHAELDKSRFDQQNIRTFVGITLDSVVIKAYRPEWSNNPKNPLMAPCRIFFSVWVNEKTIDDNKIYYNIHAFKLRLLNGYKITSRDFAKRFRDKFKPYLMDWPNCSTDYGPLTLMQGWKILEPRTCKNDVAELAQSFPGISHIIDNTIKHYQAP
ncbi:MAG: hypothetical protein J0H74_06310 [Chitinophagaceae bacterium]|nr:hypothetical protein [Chitinophagaceae bacterium]